MKERADALNREILKGGEDIVRYEVWTGYPYDPVFPDTVPKDETGGRIESGSTSTMSATRTGGGSSWTATSGPAATSIRIRASVVETVSWYSPRRSGAGGCGCCFRTDDLIEAAFR